MRKDFEFEIITITVKDEEVGCSVRSYVKAKTKDLVEYGYSSLTEEEVIDSVWKAVNKEAPTTIIDHFVQGDIILQED